MPGRTAVVVDHHPLWTTTSLEEATEPVEQLAPDLLVVEIAIGEGEPSFGAER